jgi:hypothetical protein
MATRVLVRNGMWEDDERCAPRGVGAAIDWIELAALAGSVAGLPDRRADREADEARSMRVVLPRRFHPMGAILLAGWAATAAAFVVSLW